jgi:hypothetical protein
MIYLLSIHHGELSNFLILENGVNFPEPLQKGRNEKLDFIGNSIA